MSGETFGILSVIPPILAIILAMYTRQVLVSLFAGVWAGALLVAGWNPITATTLSLRWIVDIVNDPWNAKFLILIMLMGAGAALIYKSGSVLALERWLGDTVDSSRDSQILTWLIGMFIFIDSYTSTIVTGNATRDVSLKNKTSREAHSYILDSTTAPVTTFGPVSNWIGYQVSMIAAGFSAAGITASQVGVTPYATFLKSIPWNFYCLLAFFMVGFIAISQRYYGPMLDAEWRSRKEGKVMRDDAEALSDISSDVGEQSEKNPRLINFFLPIIALLVVGVFSMWWLGGGYQAEVSIAEAFQETDIALSLLYASFAFVLTALIGALAYKTMDLDEASNAMVDGFKTMVIAAAIIILAWSIGHATDQVGTAEYVVNLLMNIGLPGRALPIIVFLAAMFISFTTGTSWGTMAILTPIAVSTGYELVGFEIVPVLMGVLFGGAIFGDHCSPISDTTVMSSIFAGSDHIDHVRTQIPFAMTAAVITIITLIVYAAGVSSIFILLPLSFILTIASVIFLNKWDAGRKDLPEVMPTVDEIEEGIVDHTREKTFNKIAVMAGAFYLIYMTAVFIFASMG
ncbi:MAG: Na+/H+ antiporter NhaC family protein [Halanaerobiales bacterium]